jgi:hypothetical protein
VVQKIEQDMTVRDTFFDCFSALCLLVMAASAVELSIFKFIAGTGPTACPHWSFPGFHGMRCREMIAREEYLQRC